MTHLVGIRLRNWMRYRGEFELELSPGCYSILAEAEGNKARSNYLGKSSFLASIRWALDYDKVEHVQLMDDLISYGEGVVGVDLELSDGTFISREKYRGKSASINVQLGDKKLEKDEAEAAIMTVLGLTREDRLSTCWAEQSMLAVPVRARPAALTATLEGWLGAELEKLVEAGDTVLQELKNESNRHALSVGTASELEAVGSDENIAKLLKEYEFTRSQFEAEQKSYDLNTKARAAFFPRCELRDLKKREAELKAPRTDPPSARETADAELEEYRAADAVVNELRSNLVNREAERDRLKKLALGQFDGNCPVSKGFVCPAKTTINDLRGPNQKALGEAQTAVDVLNGALQVARTERDEAGVELQRASDEVKQNVRIAERRKTAQVELKAVREKIKVLTAQGLEPTVDSEAAPVSYPPPSDYAFRKAEQDYTNAKKARQLLEDARRRVSDTAESVRVHRLALSVLGPEGARRRVLESTVLRIERKANQMLADAGIDLRVKALWEREVGDLAEQCPSCGRAFPSSAKVKRCECGALRGQKMSNQFRWKLNFTSGAAWDMGGLVIRCAGFEFLKAKRSAAWSVAAMDEISGQLDRHHRTSISASIRRLLVGTFEQAFLTAHDSASLEACDKRILITGGEQWSKIKVEGA